MFIRYRISCFFAFQLFIFSLAFAQPESGHRNMQTKERKFRLFAEGSLSVGQYRGNIFDWELQTDSFNTDTAARRMHVYGDLGIGYKFYGFSTALTGSFIVPVLTTIPFFHLNSTYKVGIGANYRVGWRCIALSPILEYNRYKEELFIGTYYQRENELALNYSSWYSSLLYGLKGEISVGKNMSIKAGFKKYKQYSKRSEWSGSFMFAKNEYGKFGIGLHTQLDDSKVKMFFVGLDWGISQKSITDN